MLKELKMIPTAIQMPAMSGVSQEITTEKNIHSVVSISVIGLRDLSQIQMIIVGPQCLMLQIGNL